MRSFSLLVDTFVPTDAWPGALALGIDRQLLKSDLVHPLYREKVILALVQLDQLCQQAYGREFVDLDLDDRSRLLEKLLKNRAAGDPGAQLASLRYKTLVRFYTSPEAFEMLGYHPPSQGGYPDYAKPPA